MQATGSMSMEFSDQPMDCAFHPSQKLVAASLVTGGIRLLDCSGTELREVKSIQRHHDSCRSIGFTHEGGKLVSGSADASIVVTDIEGGKSTFRQKSAHDTAIERVLPMHDSLFASGDEDGLIRTWDWRTKNRVGEYSSHTDFISDMAYHDADSCLAAASGDGSLSINDTRTQTVRERSDQSEELSAVTILKHGKKVVCGTQLGVLNIYSWGQIADCSDRMTGHPMSVDAIEKLDEDTIITGSSDGIIRVLSVQPHRLLGVLAQQEDGGCERIALSPDHRQLVTTSYGTLRLWDTSCLDEDEDDGTSGPSLEESEDDEKPRQTSPPKKRQKKAGKGKSSKSLPKSTYCQSGNFFNDLLQ